MAGRMTSRKKQALETRARIQNVALDLFDREGFENVSVEEIARAAGCSTGNIYHYFKSKDELAIQVTSRVDAAYLELEQEYAQRSVCWISYSRPCESAARKRSCTRASSTV